jgi:ADP-ribose pyrophosphatase YjhB (NUDIX family)/SAM-dependent methyltransferase
MVASENIISLYRKIYNLPELEYEEQVPDGFLSLYNEKYYFAVVSVYNLKKESLLIRDFNKDIGWELPGGYINDGESIEEAVNRITFCETGLEIDELSPVAIIKNVFKCGDQTVTHFGVAFMALSRGKVKVYPKNFQTQFTSDVPNRVAYQNSRILKLVRQELNAKKFEPPFGEIESVNAKNFSLIYLLHKYIVKPIGSLSSIKIKNAIFDLVDGSPKTILDVSCGDSSIINDLCEKYRPNLCIGNDICWKTITMMKDKDDQVFFTNHNVLDLPYKIKFDLVIFKNTFHHIEREYQQKVLNDLQKIAKQLIIIDIDDPQNSSFLSKLWNNYYVYILGDQGESFFTFKKFKELCEQKNPTDKLKMGFIPTIKGRYFFAAIKD